MPITIESGVSIGTGITIGAQPSIVSSGLTMYLTGASYPGSGTTWTDTAGGDNNATLVNSPTYSSAQGGYFTFASASAQYATVSGTPLGTTAYTKSLWFWLNSLTDNNLLSFDNDLGTGHYMFFGGTTTLYTGHTAWTGFPTTYGSVTTFITNRWYHVAVTFNTSDGMAIYVNGVLDSTYTAQKTASATGALRIGSYSAGGNLLDGRVTEIACYNRSLNASEVLQNYNATRGLLGV
jgi:hypothetical protein